MAEPKIRKRKISDYVPDSANANAGSERGLQMLGDSLQSVGVGRSLVADAFDRIPAGNKTIRAAMNAGIEDVIEIETDGHALIVHKRKDWNLDDQHGAARKYAYLDNRVAEVSLNWDAAQIAADVEAGVDLSAMFTPGELEDIYANLPGDEPPGDPGAALDRASELCEKYGVKRGQLWIIGRHRVLCGDSYSEADRARLLDGQQPDMLHTDPPYGISIVKPTNGNSAADSGGAKPFGSTAPANRKGESAVAFRNSGKVGGGRGDEASHRAHAERVHVQHGSPSKNQWSKNHPEYLVIKGDVGRVAPANIVQSNLYPVIEGDDRPFEPTLFLDVAPIVIMWGANYYADKLPPKACWITWDKRENITRNNFADCELAWTNMDSPARIFYHLWNGLHKGSQNGERRTHPTEKPVALFEEIGKLYADKGVWLDLFAGTGAQIVAAERSGATCYALEYEPLYVATIIDRLERMGLSPRLSE